MKKLIFLFILVVISENIFSQAGGNQLYDQNYRYYNKQKTETPYISVSNTNIMSFSVNALINVKATGYLAVFSVVQVGKTVKETEETMSERLNEVTANLKSKGLQNEDIFIDMISLIPKYEWETDNKLFSKNMVEVPAGFELQKNINVYYTDSRKLDEIVTACAAAEIYDLIKVDYFVNNIEEIYENLRLKSVEALNKKIKVFEKAKFSLDTLSKTIHEQKSYAYPPDRYKSLKAYRSNALTYKQSGKTTYADKQVSMYYDPVSYKDFDIVINPVIKEPVVQFSYSLQAYYKLPDENVQKNKYYIITPNGEVKEMMK